MGKSLLSKMLTGALICGTVFLKSQTVYAYTIETLAEDDDYKEIISMENELLDMARQFPNEENQSMEIEYQRAVKIYVDTNIFSLETLSPEIVSDFLKDATYLWEVPVKLSDGSCVICTVSRKPPIPEDVKAQLLANNTYTEEELAQSEAKVGQWEIPTSTHSSDHSDHIAIISDILGEAYDPEDSKMLYLLGGTPNMRMPFALFEEEDDYKIMTMEVMGPGCNLASSSSDETTSDIQENTIYDFKMVQNAMAGQQIESDKDTGIGDMDGNEKKGSDDSKDNREINDKEANDDTKAELNKTMVGILVCVLVILMGVVMAICYKKKE